MLNNILTTFMLFSCMVLSAQDSIVLTKGNVTSHVKINGNDSLTYSIYLPPDYNPKKEYPVLFALDPEGMGTRTARLFISATENLDFVIVANEFSINDSIDVAIARSIDMMNNVIRSIQTDSDQNYLSGLDEGAQVASGISYIIAGLAGVLPINDIFFKYDYLTLTNRGFVTGLVAEESSHYYNMANSFYHLATAKSENKLFEYPGEGGWPPSNILSSAISHMYFLRKNELKQDLTPQEINASFNSDYIAVRNLVTSKKYLMADDYLKELKSKYRGLHDLDSLRQEHRDLRKLDGYRDVKRGLEQAQIDEQYLLEDLEYYLTEDLSLANFENLGYWDEKLSELEQAAKNTTKPRESIVAKRMLGHLETLTDDMLLGFENNPKATMNHKIIANILLTFIDPKNSKPYLDLITLAAEDNDDNTAYFYLEELLKTGYTDYEAIYNIPETEVIKISPVYNQIVEKYLGKSKYQ